MDTTPMDTTPMDTAGMGGESTPPPTSDDPAVMQCIADLTAAGTTVGACEECLCAMCQPQLLALEGDTAASDLVDCQAATDCVGTCCLCGTECDPLGSNFGNGPCGDETQTAAGVTPMVGLAGGLANGTIVTENCAATGPDPNNSCTKALALGECVSNSCSDVCESGATCQPFM